jgi:hypothetical protein
MMGTLPNLPELVHRLSHLSFALKVQVTASPRRLKMQKLHALPCGAKAAELVIGCYNPERFGCKEKAGENILRVTKRLQIKDMG